MQTVDEIKAKLAYEILNRYIAQFPACQTVKDLEPITQLLLKQVVELALPKFRVELVPIVNEMPQDKLEESKQLMPADKKIFQILQQIQSKAQAKQQNFSKRIQDLTEEHSLMVQQQERLSQLDLENKIFETALTSLTTEIDKCKNKNLQIIEWQTKLMKQFKEIADESIKEIEEDDRDKGSKLSQKKTENYQSIETSQISQAVKYKKRYNPSNEVSQAKQQQFQKKYQAVNQVYPAQGQLAVQNQYPEISYPGTQNLQSSGQVQPIQGNNYVHPHVQVIKPVYGSLPIQNQYVNQSQFVQNPQNFASQYQQPGFQNQQTNYQQPPLNQWNSYGQNSQFQNPQK